MEATVVQTHVGAHWISTARVVTLGSYVVEAQAADRVDHLLHLVLEQDGDALGWVLEVLGRRVFKHWIFSDSLGPLSLQYVYSRSVGDESSRRRLSLSLLLFDYEAEALLTLLCLLGSRHLDACLQNARVKRVEPVVRQSREWGARKVLIARARVLEVLDQVGEDSNHQNRVDAHHGKAKVERVLDAVNSILAKLLCHSFTWAFENCHVERLPLERLVHRNRIGSVRQTRNLVVVRGEELAKELENAVELPRDALA